ncbi:PfkB family carbohydrate kinase [Streptomyces flaveolus]|uniref:PfkB family carbohydrate kinase n=1 Tax=Streptomyces flaveolus TaxID=67297 RepID=UPI00342CB37E
MITTVTLNTAADVTYVVDRIQHGGSHRLASVRRRAGGKGINAARFLAAFGHSTTVTGLVGGAAGETVRRDLAASGPPDALPGPWTPRDAVLGFSLFSAVRDAVPVPLVLHGSSGVGDADLIKAVADGMTKINMAAHLDAAFTEAVRCALRTRATSVNPRHRPKAGREAMSQETLRLLRLLRQAPAEASS